MKYSFSGNCRPSILQEMTSQKLDLLVIGGGITGAGIALDAQVRGLSTGLVEMNDFAAGTSSRSTKLVHGGLRYLKQLEFKLVAEVGKERAIVYENAPHVTTPIWMLLPLVEGGTYGKLATSVGLMIYDYLAQVKKQERRRMLNKKETLAMESLLRQDILKGGGLYVEYRTDDARLTLEILKEAVARGGLAANYAKVTGFLYQDGKVTGVRVLDVIHQREYEIFAKKIVNAAGPWVDVLREQDGSKKGKYLRLTKGVHLVIDGKRFPLKQAMYFDTADGRMVFAIPRDGKTYIGTTDTFYTGDLVNPRMTKDDRDYLLLAVNDMFPSLCLKAEDVESSWAGLRPLIHEEGKSPSELSRKDEFFISDSGLISIAGGKLTGYRKMAERIVDLVIGELSKETGKAYPACQTSKVPLSGGKVGGSAGFQAYKKQMIQQGKRLGLSDSSAEWLVRHYGSNVERIYELYSTHKQEMLRSEMDEAIFLALIYGLEDEMVVTPEDFFIRRTGALFFRMDWVQKWKPSVLQYMKDYFAWQESDREHYHDSLEKQIEMARTVANV